MITIEYHDVEETFRIGDLFDVIGFTDSSPETDADGDSFVHNEWPIDVLSLDGYYRVEGFRWTKPENLVALCHRLNNDSQELLLECSPEHIVLQQSPSHWTMVKDLRPGDKIVAKDAIHTITSIIEKSEIERLCDMQVAISHSYYTNEVMSHNSHFLTMLGANALRAGVDVLHYTFELSEAAVGIRYDSNLCDMNSNTVIDNKDAVIDAYKNTKLGRLIIKEFPTNTASIYTLRSHIERLDVKGFQPGIIIIDYADIMRSTRQFDSLRHELKLIYEELRGFASEKKIPIWTASQSNKEGSTSEIVDLSNMSEAYGKAMVADVVLSISRRAHEKSSGFGRLYVAKNRAGQDGIVYPIKIDTARSKFEIIGGEGSFESATKENEDDVKRALRLKWKELRNDPVIGDRMKNQDVE